mmetsp:Transcript_21078/g.49052  ORF Transcript_21078/g.49052 Transcript_21078/m.49052 type:complete len:771 (+) Transcript_21078:67-2379(+)
MLRLAVPSFLVAICAAAVEPNATAGDVSTTKSAAELTGVKLNGEGDLAGFTAALVLNCAIVAGCIVAFSILRVRFPVVYSHLYAQNSKEAFAEGSDPPSEETDRTGRTLQTRAWEMKGRLCDWVHYSIYTSVEDAVDRAGLDAALLREYTWLATKILGTIGIPMCLVVMPINKAIGNSPEDVDELSSVEMANVVDNHPWLFYAHAVVVWIVCFVVHKWLYAAQAMFLRLRVKWLENLPAPRSTTVLVEGIPEEWRSDERLKKFFGTLFSPEDVVEAHVVKHAEELAKAVSKREELLAMKRQAEATLEKTEKREMIRPGCCDSKVDALEYSTEGLPGVEEKIHDLLRKQREMQQQDPTRASSHCGFVTFQGRRYAELAQNIQIHADQNVWKVSPAPVPEDIRWSDLRGSRKFKTVKMLLGYLCVIGLYIGFIPITVAVTAWSTELPKQVPMGAFEPLWNTFAPTLGLMLFLSLLPSVMMAIFREFFVLKADSLAQHKLQFWFFLFQLMFVVLVTAVGRSLIKQIPELMQEPFSVFSIMAANIPHATHFYMTYLVLQWAAHAKEMLRHMNLAKFLFFRVLFGEEEAKRLSEPENQDSFGFGARSVNLSINVVLGILFCSISPMIPVLAMIDCLLARLLYGYLVIYTESKKPDLGGAFWVTQLNHIYLALALYCILMIGILQQRADKTYAWVVAAPCLLFVLLSALNFRWAFRWQKLPFEEIAFKAEQMLEDTKGHESDQRTEDVSAQGYVQPELRAAEEAVASVSARLDTWA